MSLLLDDKTRAQLKRTEPWEVRGAYQWAEIASQNPALQSARKEQLMQVVPLVALIVEETNSKLGESLRNAKVSEARVRRLLASDRDDIQDQLRTILRILKRKANIADLAATAIFWGDHQRRKIAAEYFSTSETNE